MTFGLANSPATFQLLMASVLQDLCPTACLVYLDDVIVHWSTDESHLDNLQTVFNRLQTVGLKVNPAKCCFLKKSVPFLGHIVSTKGVKTDPAKTEQIRSWPQPTSVSELRGFLGLASYYCRFIKDFAHIAAPLNRLTSKQNAFNWSDECERSFEELKRRLISPPLLAFPNISESDPLFILDTDASDVAIGAVLSQQQTDGLEHPLILASQTLTKPERNYSTTHKELLAVVTFVKKFHHYLAGKRFILRTDHQALRWLENFKDPTGQLARWQADLLEYSYTVIHRAGKKHQNADALSRRAQTSPPAATYAQQLRLRLALPTTQGGLRLKLQIPIYLLSMIGCVRVRQNRQAKKRRTPAGKLATFGQRGTAFASVTACFFFNILPPTPVVWFCRMMRSIPHFPFFMLIWDTLVKLVQTPPRVSVSGARINGGSFRTFVTRALASDDSEGPTFASHFNKLKQYALNDGSCGPVPSELPSFPSAELPHPPMDPSSIVSVPTSPPYVPHSPQSSAPVSFSNCGSPSRRWFRHSARRPYPRWDIGPTGGDSVMENSP
nr:unnamed protein product [Spirometra erinaceieuropaei]